MNSDIGSYVKSHGLDSLFDSAPKGEVPIDHSVDPSVTESFAPEWADLVRLHRTIRDRKVTTVLEFGCGYSTIVMAHALAMNDAEHGQFVRTRLRRHNAFELHVVDDVPRYIDATSGRLPEHLRSRVVFYGTDVQMTTFQGRIATEYVTLPNICPDFVYLDGPSQYSVHGEINGVSTAHPDRLPMACDLLKLEHFFLPGTLLLIDGRTANARFLQANLQRQWRHEHDVIGDLTWLELMETPLGRFNRRQLEFCLGDSWPGLADPDGPSPNLSRTRVPG